MKKIIFINDLDFFISHRLIAQKLNKKIQNLCSCPNNNRSLKILKKNKFSFKFRFTTNKNELYYRNKNFN